MRTTPYAFGLRIISVLICALSVLATHSCGPSFPGQTGERPPTLSLRATGGLAVRGGEAAYRIEVLNREPGLVEGAYVTQTLPLGVSYVPGSTSISAGGWTLALAEPAVDGQTVVWGPLRLPSAGHTENNPYGIHTFVQDFCEFDFVELHLDQALELVGSGGYVTQMFYSIYPETAGPDPCAAHFVNCAYDRNLLPILRLQGIFDDGVWQKPDPGPAGDYKEVAAAFARYVAGLPRRDGLPLYISIWNEPNVPREWGNEPNAEEYARFFVAASQAIRALGDPRIKVLNGPVTQFGEGVEFMAQAMQVPGFAESFDGWACHCYPYNHPPHYNIHDATALYPHVTIDCYLRQQEVLDRSGRGDVQFFIKETGYDLGEEGYSGEGFAPIDEENRAQFMASAFRDYWTQWPEVSAVTPFYLGDAWSGGEWLPWEWIDYYNPELEPAFSIDWEKHAVFDAVASLPKPQGEAIPRSVEISFRARVSPTITPWVYASRLSATAGEARAELSSGATVLVINPLFRPSRCGF
jgi:uncharacterized repeat protein (TIGR01451 family)